MRQVEMASLAELLREFKERSGLSYGALAKRLHLSTSTLHRYCNGDAVPTGFGPVERFARLCGATPEELVEVHRRWILADAARGRKEPEPEPEPESESKSEPSEAAPEAEPEAQPQPQSEPEPAPTPTVASGPDPVTAPSPLPPSRRRRTLVLAASVAAVVAIGSVALSLSMNGGGDGHEQSAGPASAPDPSTSPSDDSDESDQSDQSDQSGKSSDAPLTAHAKPYAYEDDCTPSFLVNRKPEEVPRPPVEQDAPGWVGDLGAVTSGDQYIEVTVRGTGKETVVLQDMNVRVQSTGEPLAWNDFQMGAGCGGRAATKSFAVDLDDAAPRVTPGAGQRDFPYQVSENDSEVFRIKASTELHDVRWYVELEWSSGKRHNVLLVDDQGKPFRTSSREGRPSYGWRDASKWERKGQSG
ncbi:helix-turn-helix domain-containing protein [Streptomyces sp. NPDC127108]|uniref:helix-turn-helix domain-containing protein n=1 Tax=Streptomyces sp. NPDC127108 TaxID=3345361 RepID=UPI0036360335